MWIGYNEFQRRKRERGPPGLKALTRVRDLEA